MIKELARGFRRRLDSFGARRVCGREENASLPIGKTASKMAKIVIIRCIRMETITGSICLRAQVLPIFKRNGVNAGSPEPNTYMRGSSRKRVFTTLFWAIQPSL